MTSDSSLAVPLKRMMPGSFGCPKSSGSLKSADSASTICRPSQWMQLPAFLDLISRWNSDYSSVASGSGRRIKVRSGLWFSTATSTVIAPLFPTSRARTSERTEETRSVRYGRFATGSGWHRSGRHYRAAQRLSTITTGSRTTCRIHARSLHWSRTDSPSSTCRR